MLEFGVIEIGKFVDFEFCKEFARMSECIVRNNQVLTINKMVKFWYHCETPQISPSFCKEFARMSECIVRNNQVLTINKMGLFTEFRNNKNDIILIFIVPKILCIYPKLENVNNVRLP